jgi:hypothetical protein
MSKSQRTTNPTPESPVSDASIASAILASFPSRLVDNKQARYRTFNGFQEIRLKPNHIEADYLISNGKMSSVGTFTIRYGNDDAVGVVIKTINDLLIDAFSKFEKVRA